MRDLVSDKSLRVSAYSAFRSALLSETSYSLLHAEACAREATDRMAFDGLAGDWLERPAEIISVLPARDSICLSHMLY